MSPKNAPVLGTALILFLAASSNAQATWSIIADNPKTQTIVVAAASCSYLVYGIAQVIPGKGVVVVQADSNAQARGDAAVWLTQNVPLPDIMARLTAADSPYKPKDQQYAVMRVDDKPAVTFTGSAVEGFKGALTTAHVSVQANTMASDRVVPDTFAAMKPDKWANDLALMDSAMKALAAGAAAGGDKRCGKAASATAYISAHRRGDKENMPWVTLVIYGIEPGTQDAVKELERQYANWRANGTDNASTRLFVVPAPQAKGND